MKSVAQDIFYLAALAQAPTNHFRHWVVAKGFSGLIPPATTNGVAGLVLTYQVPNGSALIVTRVDMFVSNHGDNTINPAQLAYPSDTTITAYWSINGTRIQTQTNTSILALGQGEQLKIFRALDNANFHVGTTRTGAIPAATVDWQFRFNGYLTTPDVAERLVEIQTVTPVFEELVVNNYEPPPDPPPYDPNNPYDPYNPYGQTFFNNEQLPPSTL